LAHTSIDKAIAIDDDGSPRGDIILQNNLGCILFRSDEYSKAREILYSAYEESIKFDEQPSYLTFIILNNLILTYYATENLKKVYSYKSSFNITPFLSNIDLGDIQKHSELLITLYENYADFLLVVAGYEEARKNLNLIEEVYKNVLEIKEKVKDDQFSFAKTYSDLANVYFDKMLYEKALTTA
jgi:tetratricopeptide (TPR) repeat protein